MIQRLAKCHCHHSARFSLFSIAVAVAGLIAGAQNPIKAQPATQTNAFREFVGTCQGSPDIPQLYDLVAWDRIDFSWSKLEPKPGLWNQQMLEKWGDLVLRARAKGVKILPILCYNAPWSWDRAERTYDYGNDRAHVKPLGNGRYIVEKYHHVNGIWALTSSKEEKPNDHWPLDRKYQGAWENYVRRTVGFLRKPPYNVEYFQIWNEAYPTSDFWGHGDLDAYMERVHLPAAKIVHELGGKVVYGGWPCCGPVQDYVAMLDRNKAWKTIDILDVHYFPLSAFEYLYREARARGYDNIGLWQTEIGFSQDPEFIGNTYPRFFSWCLAHNWSYPDRYHLFYFCASTFDDPKAFAYGRALVQGGKLSPHGLSLKTLEGAFSGGEVENFDGVRTIPPLKSEINENESSLEAFRVGERKIVVAIHLVENNDAKIFTDWNGNLGSMHLDFDHPVISVLLSGLKPGGVASAQRVDMAGQRQPLLVGTDKSGEVDIQVPVRDSNDSPAHAWFSQSKTLTFLVELTLNN